MDRITKLEISDHAGSLPEEVSLPAYIELKKTKID
jgi:hypothetical protein